MGEVVAGEKWLPVSMKIHKNWWWPSEAMQDARHSILNWLIQALEVLMNGIAVLALLNLFVVLFQVSGVWEDGVHAHPPNAFPIEAL